MRKIVKVALIGLDTSHTIEFARRMAAPDCPADERVRGLQPVSCLRFPTPFQGEGGLDERQKVLEGWGVRVTTSFDEAVAGCDALMIEINDPARHLEYFSACADLGKRIFLDKPLADTLAGGRRIFELAKAKNVRIFSMSSLRLAPALAAACSQMARPLYTHAYGPFGRAPTGSSMVWYGVHTFEMLARADGAGVTVLVQYPDNRRGVVELADGAYVYGGCLRDRQRAVPFVSDPGRIYSDLLEQVAQFFRTGVAPVEPEDTLEVMAMLDAAQRSLDTRSEAAV